MKMSTFLRTLLLGLLIVLFLGSALPLTNEDNEIPLLSNLVLGWTKESPTGNEYRFTLRLNSSEPTWFGVGTSQAFNINTPKMTTRAAAIIANYGPALLNRSGAEFELVSETPAGIIPWGLSRPPSENMLQCVQRVCPDQVLRCQSQESCSNALQCSSLKFSGNGTSDLGECTDMLGSGNSPESINAMSSFFDSVGCYFESCAEDLQRPRVDQESVTRDIQVSTVFDPVSNRWLSTLSFITSRIGYTELSDERVMLIAAHGNDMFSKSHNVTARVSFILNLATGETFKLPTPSWIVGHAIIMFLSFGLLVPFSVCLRIRGYTHETMLRHFHTQVIATVGAFVAYFFPLFYMKDLGGRSHHVLGLFLFVLVILQLIFTCFRPSPTSTTSLCGPLGAKEVNEDERIRKHQTLELWNLMHSSFGYLFLILVTVNIGLGYALVGELGLDFEEGSLALVILSVLATAAAILYRVQQWYQDDDSRGHRFIRKPKPNRDDREGDDARRPTPFSTGADMSFNLIFKDLTYIPPLTAKQRKDNETPKPRLDVCSGFFPAASLTAIMGPSGAGKSTLLNILAGRCSHPLGVDSKIQVNGASLIGKDGRRLIARISGYVLQQDVLHQYLSVSETLWVVAKLISPQSDRSKIKSQVENVIEEVDLVKETDRNAIDLSGGQRRRLSLAIELIKDPSILFLDEITSGLDSTVAKHVVKVLYNRVFHPPEHVAKKPRTMLVTIHQTSSDVFQLFGRVLLMARGCTLFCGKREDLVSHFQAIVKIAYSNRRSIAEWIIQIASMQKDDDDNGGDANQKQNGGRKEATSNADKVLDDIRENDEIYGADDPNIFPVDSDTTASPTSRSFNSTRSGGQTSTPPRKATSKQMETAMKQSWQHGNNHAMMLELQRKLNPSLLHEASRGYFTEWDPELIAEDPGHVPKFVQRVLTTPGGLDKIDENELKPKYRHSLRDGYDALTKIRFEQDVEQMEPKPLHELTEGFFKSIGYKELRTEMEHYREVTADKYLPQNQDKVSLSHQIFYLIARNLNLIRRDFSILGLQAIVNTGFGLILGWVYANVKTGNNQAYTTSMVLTSILGIIAATTLTVSTTVSFSDKQVFVREQYEDFYTPSAYFFARLITGLPMCFILAMCLILPAYLIIGLRPGVIPFMFFALVTFALVFLFDGVAAVTSISCPEVSAAFFFGNLYAAISILVSGIFVPYHLIPIPLLYLYYVTPFSYAYAAAAVNEFQGTTEEYWLDIIGLVWDNKINNISLLLILGVCWRLLAWYLMVRFRHEVVEQELSFKKRWSCYESCLLKCESFWRSVCWATSKFMEKMRQLPERVRSMKQRFCRRRK